ncbi:Glutamine cyclotransferase [hydrothermal vent metagenome]|uniref:Glutamine cyclotransferase n=1 Tax=hydrothermal vent metagenome TaxID=652676 RepID=A0A3B0VJ72_9ZZZZ
MAKTVITKWLGCLLSVLFFLTACTNSQQPLSEPAAVVETAVSTPLPTTTATVTPTAVPTCDPFTTSSSDPLSSVPSYSFEIINSTPHDPTAFTQGLLYVDGILYESTGTKLTPSSLRRVDLSSGEVLQIKELGGAFFGEGLTLWQDKLIQLTWQNRVAFVYDKDSFIQLNSWQYDTEGWGLTHNGRCLIMSDGSNNLTFRDPETFAEVGRIAVFDENGPVTLLNELEYIDGEIWANVWQSNRIVRINPENGQVVGSIDLTGLLDIVNLTERVDVLNGIAYDAENGRIFVTGKLWPTLFEIKVVPAPAP